MTVKELKEILNTVDENKRVYFGSVYSNDEINGYYLQSKGDELVLVLSSLNVQPRC